jgi:hypothetical protein
MRDMPLFRLQILLFMQLLAIPRSLAQGGGTSAYGFKPGQVWSIKPRGLSPTRIVVVKIEAWNETVAIHVSLNDVRIPADLPGGGRLTNIGHMPFAKAALEASVDELLATSGTPEPDFEVSYARWRQDNGGIFTVSVDQAVRALFDTLRRSRP